MISAISQVIYQIDKFVEANFYSYCLSLLCVYAIVALWVTNGILEDRRRRELWKKRLPK